VDLKFEGVKSRTSEAPSAFATQTRARAVREERMDETLIITVVEVDGEELGCN
jgi:hypothetical protein